MLIFTSIREDNVQLRDSLSDISNYSVVVLSWISSVFVKETLVRGSFRRFHHRRRRCRRRRFVFNAKFVIETAVVLISKIIKSSIARSYTTDCAAVNANTSMQFTAARDGADTEKRPW